MRTSVNLPDDLLERARKRAAEQGCTLTALIEEGLRSVVTDRPVRQVRAQRQLPRVSVAQGGLLPGFDAMKLNTQAEEFDDIERLAKIRPKR